MNCDFARILQIQEIEIEIWSCKETKFMKRNFWKKEKKLLEGTFG